MNIYELRDKAEQEIVDYNQLKDALKSYSHPRKKISSWLHKGELIRIKKGLYIFGESISREPFSLEVLANLIYGPSAISLNYALSYYGMIPEAVHTITSITNKRNKIFETPVGRFSYRYLSHERYTIGIELLTLDNGINFLIASPEKALCDVITLSAKDITFKSQQNLEDFLLRDLRIDEDALKEMNLSLINEITHKYANSRLSQFTKYFRKWIK